MRNENLFVYILKKHVSDWRVREKTNCDALSKYSQNMLTYGHGWGIYTVFISLLFKEHLLSIS